MKLQQESTFLDYKFVLAAILSSAFVCTVCTSCAPKTKPSQRMIVRSLERGYRDKKLDKEISHIFALLQYDPNTANQIIEDHLSKADREWPFYALLGDVLIEAKRYDYAEPVLKLAYSKLIKRIPSAEIHDSKGPLPIETGLDFQVNHDPRRLIAKLYVAKIADIKGDSIKENALREQFFKEAIYFNPRNNVIWKSYSVFLWKQNRKEESLMALGNIRNYAISLDRGDEVQITGVKTPWSAADQDNTETCNQRSS